jgi:hypothetical protein
LSNRKIEFEKIGDEWIITVFQLFKGIYSPIDRIRGVESDKVRNMIIGEINEGRRITIWEE